MASPMNIQSFHFNLQRREPYLFYAGCFVLLLAIIYSSLSFIDSRQFLGVSYWFKLVKFSLSFGLYLLTFAYFIPYLTITESKKKLVSKIIVGLILAEITILSLQAMCDEPYHFSLSMPLTSSICYNMTLFILANFFIVASTIAAFYIFIQFFKKVEKLPTPYLLSIRLGLALFLISCFQGAFIAFHNAYIPEDQIVGSLGLPFLSPTIHGDLKTSHFVGIHALQVIPLIGYFCKDLINGKTLVYIFSFLYTSIFIVLFVQAIRWVPFF